MSALGHPAPSASAAAVLRTAIRSSPLPRAEIAWRASLPSEAALLALEHGTAPIPYLRIPALARALDLDETVLLLAVLADTEPGLHMLLTEVIGLPLSPVENALLAWYRLRCLGTRTDDQRNEEELLLALQEGGPAAILP